MILDALGRLGEALGGFGRLSAALGDSGRDASVYFWQNFDFRTLWLEISGRILRQNWEALGGFWRLWRGFGRLWKALGRLWGTLGRMDFCWKLPTRSFHDLHLNDYLYVAYL